MESDCALDGQHWQLKDGAQRAKATNYLPEKKLKRRVSDSPTAARGRSRLAFTDCAKSTQYEKLRGLHEKLVAAAQKILAEEEDTELVEMWKKKYDWFGDAPIEDDSLLVENVKELYQSLPQSSIIKTVLIKDLYKGYTQKEIMDLLDLSRARVSEALSIETKPLSYYLSSLGIPRNRCALAEIYVLNWFSSACPVPSGKNNRCFFGTPISMYFEYRMWCAQCEVCNCLFVVFTWFYSHNLVLLCVSDEVFCFKEKRKRLVAERRYLLGYCHCEDQGDREAAGGY